MASGEGNGNGADSVSKDRATVALVDAKLDGLKLLTEQGFGSLQRQLDTVAGLPAAVAKLDEKHTALARRVDIIEKDDERHIEWRKGAIVTAITLTVGILANVSITFHWF